MRKIKLHKTSHNGARDKPDGRLFKAALRHVAPPLQIKIFNF
jgi:hypothetical protein